MFQKYSNSFIQNFDLDDIVSKFKVKHFISFEKDCYIFSENDPITNIFFILSGKVEIRKSSMPIYHIGKGDLIGIDDTLTGNIYCNSAYVLKKTRTLSVRKNDFFDIIKSHDDFRLWILKYLSTRISSLG